MIKLYLRIRGKRRIKRGICPQCKSSPPDVTCKICRGDERYGPNASVTQKWVWNRRYNFYLKHRRD